MSSVNEICEGDNKLDASVTKTFDIESVSVLQKAESLGQTTALKSEDHNEAELDIKSLPVLISDSDSVSESVTVSESNVLPELLIDSMSYVKSELSSVLQTDSLPELIASTDLLGLSVADYEPTKEPSLKPVSVDVLQKVSPSKTFKTVADIVQDTVYESKPAFESVLVFETSSVSEQDVEFASLVASKERVNLDSTIISEIIATAEPVFEPHVVSNPDAMWRSIPASESVSVFETTADSEQSVEFASIEVAKEKINPETTTGLNIIAASETDIVSKSIPVSESVLAFDTVAVPEQSVESTSVPHSKEGVKFESATRFETTDDSESVCEPNVVFESDIVSKSALVSDSLPILETIAVLERDVEFQSRTDPHERRKQKSASVLELEEASELVLEPCVVSQSDTVSESILVFDTADDSNLSVEFASVAVSKERVDVESSPVLEITADSETVFEPKCLKISSSGRTVKNVHPDTSACDRKFRILFDLSRIDKDNLSIKIFGDKIDIFGIQRSENEFEEEYHEVHQIFTIPEYVDDNGLIASVTDNDMLLLEAPLKKIDSNISANVTEIDST